MLLLSAYTRIHCSVVISMSKLNYLYKHHPAGRGLTSDWPVNSFIIMIVYEKFFNLSQNFLSKARLKKFSQTVFITLLISRK